MKLSEAIRLGAALKPQGFGTLDTNGHTCAIGAALDAVGQLDRAVNTAMPYEVAQNLWPILRANDYELMSAIIRANDGDHQTREVIADFVEQYEDFESAQAAQDQPVAVTVNR